MGHLLPGPWAIKTFVDGSRASQSSSAAGLRGRIRRSDSFRLRRRGLDWEKMGQNNQPSKPKTFILVGSGSKTHEIPHIYVHTYIHVDEYVYMYVIYNIDI